MRVKSDLRKEEENRSLPSFSTIRSGPRKVGKQKVNDSLRVVIGGGAGFGADKGLSPSPSRHERRKWNGRCRMLCPLRHPWPLTNSDSDLIQKLRQSAKEEEEDGYMPAG